jgi:itaconyl-CoA hydratase
VTEPGSPRLDDFAVDQVYESGAVTVTETHLVNWSNLTGDWYPLHMDAEYARNKGPFGQRVAHGPLVFALSVGLIERANVLGRSVLAWLGADEMRALRPVFIGDTVRVRVTVLEARASRSDPSRGVLSLRYDTLNQSEEVVMSFRYSLLIRSRLPT